MQRRCELLDVQVPMEGAMPGCLLSGSVISSAMSTPLPTLADGIHIDCGDDTVSGLVISLTVCYYTWGLMYPKHFQILAFMQTHFIQDQNNWCSHIARPTKFEKLLWSLGMITKQQGTQGKPHLNKSGTEGH